MFQVGQWMVGVKRLIQEAREVEAPLSPTDTTISLQTDTASSSAVTVPVTSQAELVDSNIVPAPPTEGTDVVPAETDTSKDQHLSSSNFSDLNNEPSQQLVSEQSGASTQTAADT